MKVGSLFSGGGLGDFGFLAAGMEIAWQCEIDPYCQKILALRYPESKKYHDIKTLKGTELEAVDIMAGGFPCQPFSYAGNKRGDQDNRYLWPEMLRVISEVRHRWVVGENVAGIINLAIDRVLTDLEALGYTTEAVIFPAHAIGAPHRRDRVWIMANSTGLSGATDGKQQDERLTISGTGSQRELANSFQLYAQGRIQHGKEEWKEQGERSFGLCGWREWWKTEPAVGRVANGITDRVHRLKMLGNGQVPACTYVIGKMIMEIEGK